MTDRRGDIGDMFGRKFRRVKQSSSKGDKVHGVCSSISGAVKYQKKSSIVNRLEINRLSSLVNPQTTPTTNGLGLGCTQRTTHDSHVALLLLFYYYLALPITSTTGSLFFGQADMPRFESDLSTVNGSEDNAPNVPVDFQQSLDWLPLVCPTTGNFATRYRIPIYC
jgi:hypothetical protein